MKILVCIPCLMTGGTEIQTLSLVEALLKVGHKVNVVCYFEHTQLMVDRYRDAGAMVTLLSAQGDRPVGLKATTILLWRGLKTVIKSFRPDVSHVQYMAPGALSVLVLKALGVKRIVATAHTPGDIYSPIGRLIIRILTNHLLTAFQCITELAERSYFGSSHMFDPKGTLQRHFTIYNNIPSHISILDGSRRKKSASGSVVLGVVSRLEPIKGMDLVIPAFAKAAAKSDKLKLLIVGDGSQRELMEHQAREAGISDNVEFVGRQPQSALQNYYDRIDILLMPSRSEGFGLTAIEGMARGCVPIVSRVGGLPEVVTSDCGLLHNPDDIDDLAGKILAITSDISLLNLLSSASISRASLFSTSRYNQSISQFYEKIQTSSFAK